MDPNTGRIFLEFDDPSRGSCEVTLAYSSLTAGSFIDECFDAGVNTNVSFDTSLSMPQTGGQPNAVPSLAPRSEDEFNELVLGRDDFIPGLVFGSVCHYCPGAGYNVGPGWASSFEYDPDSKSVYYKVGRYKYRTTVIPLVYLRLRKMAPEPFRFLTLSLSLQVTSALQPQIQRATKQSGQGCCTQT